MENIIYDFALNSILMYFLFNQIILLKTLLISFIILLYARFSNFYILLKKNNIIKIKT